MKKIGFLSFGHWGPYQGSQTRTAADSLLQAIDLAQGAEQLGIDGLRARTPLCASASQPFPASNRHGGAHLQDRAGHRRRRHALADV